MSGVWNCLRCVIALQAILTAAGLLAAEPPLPAALPGPKAMAAATEDVWGEAALRQPGGASYEFFKDLLPPLRYVNTEFRQYPIVLSAPSAPVKARFVSNGSGINLRANSPPMWREIGVPVSFFVGDGLEPFGDDAQRRQEPRYVDGYLPIVGVGYSAGQTAYRQECFAGVRGAPRDHGAVFVRFIVSERPGRVIAKIGANMALTAKSGFILSKDAQALVWFSQSWAFESGKRQLTAVLDPGKTAELVIFTRPRPNTAEQPPPYDEERRACIEEWKALLARGSRLDVPEPIIQDAWRSLVIGNYLIADGDRMNYSAGNAYDHLYEGECGDAVRSLMLFGHVADARKMVGPLLRFNRKATRFHVAGHKLQLLAHYYWVTRDKDYLKEQRAVWEPVVDFILASRKTENGLLPKDNYAGDVNQQVYSLNSNAACWRGLRDMAAVIEEIGEKDRAAQWRKEAEAFRTAILDAVAKSERRDAKPPFIPMSLLANEEPHHPLTATRIGSYYDLMIPYVLGSGIFGTGNERESWIIDYLRQHGGLALGMIRSMPHQGQFKGEPGVNVLYGLRYQLTLLRRGDRGHVLVGFYGHLAQAMTRGTFIGGEGSRFFHGDRFGRSFYLPPNSAANATFLTTLRYLLIQDWDLDDDGRPETLRLLDAIPSRWLADGTTISVHNAPTAFGEVSFRLQSKLKQGEIVVTAGLPPRPLGKWQLRLPDPPGYTIEGARVNDARVTLDSDKRIDVTGQKQSVTVRFVVRAKP